MGKKYYPTIGLEIHAELKTQTKMFCGCKNDPDEKNPNVNICPICMAHPGALPVINKKAVENVIKVGLAIDGKIADFTEFDRKNYFYPDIPKGFQISQYKYPIVSGGHLADFDVTRVHLEEDTANNKHDRGNFSLIDFNRAGVPLMELVTEPKTFEDAEIAAKGASIFAKEFQLVLWYLGVSEANMEKGEMRVEANISVSEDKNKLGTKVEVKNLNSFKSVEKAIKFELDRMIELLENGKKIEIIQETRGWDEEKQKTFSQRKKESSQDYRYFPEPDLPKMRLHEAFDLEKMKKELPELPQAKRLRYKNDFGIKDEDIESYINDKELGSWFEEIAKILNDKDKVKIASNYITSDYLGLKKNNPNTKITKTQNFAELINLLANNKISSRAAKNILAMIIVKDESPLKIATEKGLLQKNDEGEIKSLVEKIIAKNPEVVATYKTGKENAIMSLVGKIIKESKGSANPQIVVNLLKDLLK
ncbi:MAG: Aspartyl/glutamyl-tRNA(Asn/Gln) amidotransferase subunit B [Candidatus Nomurabacteria bacterium GW2011_GWB1_35_20]|uniref:Aspartyl/glutamyl-tRNA(Asn/Gln) amidotransferase subunit B n=3 Tax=Candidatus Nomuraibacteriota TaxID=1752729 RepID=A0A0G0DU95_9BACT|nr:MAG: Aspartyl/glutamyl-tRNA(Asn/Gln) amidotransferase subunit B [Candidatus Nomurabacteria bacterium GW2011_GWB1_35_20]KKP76415.1 MAG: Aspartyl/glutamyl-tRNA(Asn/Gln) amidotransferase subunit B [Parcubacteria group bacterium GW2011_GWC1_35_21]KKP77533.1 MAG: Aspartyl/glutamyl-tRNA(Asn/Gln) amidotransferase subunit B [Candidatus Nomurabacteria bacterium GW2011_GWC2_35_35]KKP84420.1 MAG: Aspartyl/glutamyl-tRNA(Asn/Gln) amidotransferase subunit B [Parcubacteria group bacterium GW2011_GWD2_35_7]